MAALLCSCANFRPYRTPVLPYQVNDPMPVVFLDSRPDVLSGEITAAREGTEYATAGIPYPINVNSGQSLSANLSVTLGAFLSASKMYRAVRDRPVPPSKDPAHARATAIPTQPDEHYGLFFNISDFHFTCGGGTCSLRHTVTLEVLGRDGQTLGSAKATGDEDTGHGTDRYAANCDLFLKLLTDPSVMAALTGRANAAPAPAPAPAASPSAAPTPAPAAGPDADWSPPPSRPTSGPPPASAPNPASADSCSVDQVLKMKSAGLSDDQIKRACQNGK